MRALESLSRDPLAVLMPQCHEPAELDARRRLMRARDFASAKLPYLLPSHALTLYWLIVETAAAWIFAPATLEDLEAAVRYCRRLLLCARWAESGETQHNDED
jgi:hypothetical protein